MRVRAVAIGLLLAAARLPAQEATTIQGQVLVDADGQSLPRARVTLGAAASTQLSVLSDDTGRFRLALPSEVNGPVARRITVAKAGFATLVTTITLQDFASGQPLTIRLQRSVAVSGRVVDRQGNAVTSALVAVRPAPLEGARPSSSARLAVLAETNDLGEYRVGGLGEGRYVVAVVNRYATSSVDGTSPDPGRIDRLNAALTGGADPATAIPEATSTSVFVQLQPGRDVDDLLLTTRGPTQMPGLCPASPAAAGDGTGVISGRVINQRGEPVMCANVRLLTRGREPVVATDAEGRFEFAGLPAGRYGLETTKILHLTGRYGSERSGAPSTRIALADGRTLRDLDILLPTGSAIMGTVVDEAGEPVAGVMVRALRPRGPTDSRFASSAFGAAAQRTDDRGRFRLFGLPPGTYFVAAATNSGIGTAAAGEGWPATLYPGTTDAALASALRIDAGRDLSGIDITLGPPPAARVTGFAFDADGQPARGVLLGASQRTGVLLLEPRTATAGPDGAFAFPSVPPGEYVLQTTGPIGGLAFAVLGRAFQFGMAYVTVGDTDPPPVTVRAGRGSVVEGRVVAESGSTTTVSVGTIPTDFDRSPIVGMGSRGLTMRSDGAFRLEGVTGPRRIVKAGGPDESYLRSAVVNGRDALDTPFDFGLGGEAFRDVEVVVANDSASVSGQVVDGRQNPVEQYVVRLFSTDPAQWFSRSQRLKVARSASNGRFRITGAPPGDYWLVALERSEDPLAASDTPEPAQLEELSRRAERVTLEPSGARQFTLTLGGP
jgi:protocatechuate 3,4-dioxygenase beta subunit